MANASTQKSQLELIVVRSGHPDRRVLLQPGVLSLGRAEDNDLVLPDIGVSRKHARITVDESGVTIEDLGSGNGTLFQGRPVRKKRLENNDVLHIDPFDLRFVIPNQQGQTSESAEGPCLVLLSAPQEKPGSVHPIPANGLTLGRATNQGVVLNDPGASRQHAILFPRQGGCWLQDNRSANGTFVNEDRVFQHMVKHGDVIRIGTTTLRLDMRASQQAGGPLSHLWQESGVYPRPIRDDDDPAASTLPDFKVPVSRSLRPADAPQQEEAPVQNRHLVLVGVLLSLLVVLVVFASVVLPRLLTGAIAVPGLPQQDSVEVRPPDVSVPDMVSASTVGERLVIAQALLANGRPLEAATPVYQALQTEPDIEELDRLGYVACEAAVMQFLVDDLRRAQLSESISSRTVRELTRAVDRTGNTDLPDLRASLADALLVFPANNSLIRAQSVVDSRLAGLAVENIEESQATDDELERWRLIEEALVLSPTTRSAAQASWTIISEGRAVAMPLIAQALSMENTDQHEEASRLYATAAARLPGQNDPLERLARARMDALAR